MIILGITGAIGSGKSTVSHLLRKRGYSVIDLDEIAKKVLTEGDVKKAVLEVFGEDILDGAEICRKKLAEKVFSEKDKLKALERITHPKIVEFLERKLKELEERGEDVVFVEAPLLFETRSQSLFDKVIVVFSEKEEILRRMEKRGFTESETIKRLEMQLPIEEKVRNADYVIENMGDIEDLEREISKLEERIEEWRSKDAS